MLIVAITVSNMLMIAIFHNILYDENIKHGG